MNLATHGLTTSRVNALQELYLDLMKRSLTRFIDDGAWQLLWPVGKRSWKRRVVAPVQWALGRAGLALCRRLPRDEDALYEGHRYSNPPDAETYLGLRSLNQLQAAVVDVLQHGVPGDLMETGVWRGGAVIF